LEFNVHFEHKYGYIREMLNAQARVPMYAGKHDKIKQVTAKKNIKLK